LNVNIHGSTNQVYYLPLYSRGGGGTYTPSNKIFYGTIGMPAGLAAYGYITCNVNGIDKYIKVYTGTFGSGCCSDVVGTLDLVNPYTLEGYAYVNCNGSYYWISLYM
jgi:hypothetical protein